MSKNMTEKHSKCAQSMLTRTVATMLRFKEDKYSICARAYGTSFCDDGPRMI